MATLTPTLTLSSSDAFTHQNISISVTDNLTVEAPFTDVSRFDTGDNIGNGAGIIIPNAHAKDTYVYVRHTGLDQDGSTASTNLVTLSDANAANSHMRLGAGEFAFFCVLAGDGLKAVSATQDVLLEFAFFTKT
tara:strand:+ start:1134 stop:1535 length:402 start_codon:yes stop_codon:yes gene_type:complete